MGGLGGRALTAHGDRRAPTVGVATGAAQGMESDVKAEPVGAGRGTISSMTPPLSTAAPELDELTVTIVVDNATDTLSSIAPGVPQLPEMAHLLGSIPPSGQHDGHNCVVGFDQLCVACHGFSALATARQGERTATVLFDVVPYGDVWLANAGRLAIGCPASTCCFCRTATGIILAASRPSSRPSRRRATAPVVRRWSSTFGQTSVES
jgi:hypothetical protein